ncbi:MAG: YceI family protein [Candidatus Dormibacteria bacterium]
MNTNQTHRGAHLRSTDFFSAEKHPEMTFRSTVARDLDDNEYRLDCDLTINESDALSRSPSSSTG